MRQRIIAHAFANILPASQTVLWYSHYQQSGLYAGIFYFNISPDIRIFNFTDDRHERLLAAVSGKH